jgi:hypothetical protein
MQILGGLRALCPLEEGVHASMQALVGDEGASIQTGDLRLPEPGGVGRHFDLRHDAVRGRATV